MILIQNLNKEFVKYNQRNIIYTTRFDGEIFQYRTTKLASPLFRLFGFSTKVDMPINVVLSYHERRVLAVLHVLKLVVHRHRFGQDEPNPYCLPRIFFVGRFPTFLKELKRVMNRNIEMYKEGRNVGLMDLYRGKFLQSRINPNLVKRLLFSAMLMTLGAFGQHYRHLKKYKKPVTVQVVPTILNFEGTKYGLAIGANIEQVFALNYFFVRDYNYGNNFTDGYYTGFHANAVIRVSEFIENWWRNSNRCTYDFG